MRRENASYSVASTRWIGRMQSALLRRRRELNAAILPGKYAALLSGKVLHTSSTNHSMCVQGGCGGRFRREQPSHARQSKLVKFNGQYRWQLSTTNSSPVATRQPHHPNRTTPKAPAVRHLRTIGGTRLATWYSAQVSHLTFGTLSSVFSDARTAYEQHRELRFPKF